MAFFHLFSSLPTELQDKIWQTAIADIPPRIISIRDRFTHPNNISTLGLLPPRPPALLHACHTSRRLAIIHRYSCAFAYAPIRSFVWMDYETDILDLQKYFLNIHPDTHNLKRVRVLWGCGPVDDSYGFRVKWLHDFEQYKNLREIEIVTDDEYMASVEGLWDNFKWPCERSGLVIVDATGRKWPMGELDRVIGKWRRVPDAPQGQWVSVGQQLRELADR